MSSQSLETLKQSIDIVEHIKSHEPLDSRDGQQFTGFHRHNDSKGMRCLSVSRLKRVFNCFHCQIGGSVLDYEIDRLGTDLNGAIQSLRQQYNLVDPNITDRQRTHWEKVQKERSQLQSVLLEASEFYHSQLGGDYLNYCLGRGLTEQTLNTQRIGYAAGKNKLYDHLSSLGFSDQNLEKSGLFFRNDNGALADRYHESLVIFFWHHDQIVFSIGRSFNPQAKSRYSKHLLHQSYPYVSKLIKNKLFGVEKISSEKPIMVAEGIIDALLAKQELENYTVVSSASNFFSKMQAKDFSQVLINKKPHQVIFMADNESSQAGLKGARRSVDMILQAMPEDERESWTKHLYITTLPCPPELDKVDLADYLQQGKLKQVQYFLTAGKTIEQLEQYRKNDPSRFFNRRNGFTSKRLADELLLDAYFFVNSRDQLCQYKNGVYRPNQAQLEQICQRKLGESSNFNRISETCKYLKIHSPDEEIKSNNTMLNLANCSLDLISRESQKHSPDRLTTTQIPVFYDSSAGAKKVDQFIRQIVPSDCVELIYQIFGYCLLPSNLFEKSFIFLGAGSNGKSTLVKLLIAFLGPENVSKITLQDLAHNRFRPAELYRRMANISTDLEKKTPKSMAMFKAISTGDPITVERKFGDPFSFEPYCKQIYSCNQLPNTRDHSHGFYRRLLIIPFPNRFEDAKRDEELINKLTTADQLSGLLNRSLDGLDQLKQQRGFRQTTSTAQALLDYQLQSDSCSQFIRTHCRIQEESMIEKDVIYQKYQQFCLENDLEAESRQVLNRTIEQIFSPSVLQKRQKTGNSSLRVWSNLTFSQPK